jgi:hypothetical protein
MRGLLMEMTRLLLKTSLWIPKDIQSCFCLLLSWSEVTEMRRNDCRRRRVVFRVRVSWGYRFSWLIFSITDPSAINAGKRYTYEFFSWNCSCRALSPVLFSYIILFEVTLLSSIRFFPLRFHRKSIITVLVKRLGFRCSSCRYRRCMTQGYFFLHLSFPSLITTQSQRKNQTWCWIKEGCLCIKECSYQFLRGNFYGCRCTP